MLCIDEASLVAIKEHGQRAYPEECCGIIFGKANETVRSVVELRPLVNRNDESPRNRFLIDARDMFEAQQYARVNGVEIIGFYHSHPDADARPSEFDREHAWPWYCYMIISVKQGCPNSLTCWQLDEDRSHFHSVEISMATSDACNIEEEKHNA